MGAAGLSQELLHTRVTATARAERHGHGGGVLWFTGLSGSGKSTLATGLEQVLFAKGYQVFVLDGDNVRHGLNGDLGFSDSDRRENIRRVSEIAALFSQAGAIVISAFISPFEADRDRARGVIGDGFHEIFLDADLKVCEARDPKGLYKKARAGEISDFTGISSRYERPKTPAMTLDTGVVAFETCLEKLENCVRSAFL